MVESASYQTLRKRPARCHRVAQLPGRATIVTMTTVLLVEDDAALAGMLASHLTRDGLEVIHAADGATALNLVARHSPAAVVLDIGLPGLDGYEVCRVLRRGGDWTPLLFLTARDSEDDRVLGMDIGADDYLTKPFSPRELSARLRALLRRTERTETPPTPPREVRLGDLTVGLDSRRVTAATGGIDVTPKEFELLAFLVARPGRVLSRASLLREVWGPDSEAGERTVDVHVAQLRAKGVDVIRTVRGSGYSAEAPR